MKYPAGISGETYAAMEEGYDQGRESMRAEKNDWRDKAVLAAGRATDAEAERHQLMRELVRAEADLEGLKGKIRTLARVASENDGRVDFDTLMGIAYGSDEGGLG